MALVAALLGWMFDGFEMGIMPLVARPALVELLGLKEDAAQAQEGTDPQLKKHLRIALGSANEVEDELHTLHRRGFLQKKDEDLLIMARRLCAMLAKFIQRLDADSKKTAASK